MRKFQGQAPTTCPRGAVPRPLDPRLVTNQRPVRRVSLAVGNADWLRRGGAPRGQPGSATAPIGGCEQRR